MNINSILIKENITNPISLDKNSIDVIAKDIAIKLCLALPEHNLNKDNLYKRFKSLNMFFATLPEDTSGAKYVPYNNSIYFNKDLSLSEIPNVAMHECIHFLQTVRYGKKITAMGLYNFNTGLALNEAAVQLIAADANMCNPKSEKYFGITLSTISPDYYPLECALVSQMAFFVGPYSLTYSTLTGSDVFKTTFCDKFGSAVYDTISYNLDKLLKMQTDLNILLTKFATCNDSSASSIRENIDSKKLDIKNLFFKIQNYIIEKCFYTSFCFVSSKHSFYDFSKKLYEYKKLIGTCEHYTFYDEFCRKIEVLIEERKNNFMPDSYALSVMPTSNSFFKTLINKIKLLLGLNKPLNNKLDRLDLFD